MAHKISKFLSGKIIFIILLFFVAFTAFFLFEKKQVMASPCMTVCGDGFCQSDAGACSESCSTCQKDCGLCPPTPRCGDGACNGTETCSTCQADCGSCGPRCGDGYCNGSETCSTCPGDCGSCCTDQCANGQKKCVGNYAQTCVYNNSNGCYEWGGTVYCPYGCTNGQCNSCTSNCSGKQCGADDGCGNPCQTGSCSAKANATAVCASGSCVYSCISGFGDCDNNMSNGCEAVLNSDVNNCGSCGNKCPKFQKDSAGKENKCMLGNCDASSCKYTPVTCVSGKVCDPADGICKKPICLLDSNCGTSKYTGSPFCKPGTDDEVWQNKIIKACNNAGTLSSSCTTSTASVLKQKCDAGNKCDAGKCKKVICSKSTDCGYPAFWGNPFCKTGDYYNVYQKIINYLCNKPGTVNSSCANKTIDYTVKNCGMYAGCSKGKCVDINCFSDADCGTPGYIGNPFCWAGSVYQRYETYACIDPGTIESSCVAETDHREKQECNSSQECFNGQCIDENHCCMCVYQEHSECDLFNVQGVDWKNPKNISADGTYGTYGKYSKIEPKTIEEACGNFFDLSWSTPDCIWVAGRGCMSRFKKYCLDQQDKDTSVCKVFQIFPNPDTTEEKTILISGYLNQQKCSSLDYYEHMHGIGNADCLILGKKIKACMECVSGNCSIYKESCSVAQDPLEVNELAKSIQKKLCQKKDYTTVIKIKLQQAVSASYACPTDEVLYITCNEIKTSYINCDQLSHCFEKNQTVICSKYIDSVYQGEKKYICCQNPILENLEAVFVNEWMPYNINPTCDPCINSDGTKKNCSSYFDNTGKKVFCGKNKDGKCGAGKRCNSKGKCQNACSTTVWGYEIKCGYVEDDQNKLVSCGKCAAGKKCQYFGEKRDKPTYCMDACWGIECGDKSVDDKGNIVTCKENKGKCVDQSKVCNSFGKCVDPCLYSRGMGGGMLSREECGTLTDDYGGSVTCGVCASGKWCVGKSFDFTSTPISRIPSLSKDSDYKDCFDVCKIDNDIYCGEVTDAAGKIYQCGNCPSGQTCDLNKKCIGTVSVLPSSLLEQVKSQLASLLDIIIKIFIKK